MWLVPPTRLPGRRDETAMPNSFAYLVLGAWPAFAVMLYRLLPFERALIWSILGPYLLLPPKTAFDLPMVPALDKVSIPNLVALVCCVLLCGRRLKFRPDSPVATLLLILFLVSPFATVMTNSEPAVFGSFVIPGLRVYDAAAAVANQVIFLLPFFLARQFLATEKAQREILFALMVAGLLYSVPMLIEVRLSPQLNTWIYGFFQHSFEQMMRQGGFRPIVFLEHGLWVAFFAMTSLIAAAALWRMSKAGKRIPTFLAAVYLAIVLVLCKSLGSLIYAILLAPLVVLGGRQLQMRIAALLAVLAVAYPLLRGANLVPVEWLVTQAESIEVDRALSLDFRLQNEAVLLDRASEKPLFGWGSWGRNQLYDPNDPSGKMLTVTDGRWIIVIGSYGWVGYIAEFGLMAFSILLLHRRAGRSAAGASSPYAGVLSLLLAINMVDLIPNATLIPFTWLLAGALLGHAERTAHAETHRDPTIAKVSSRSIMEPGRNHVHEGRTIL